MYYIEKCKGLFRELNPGPPAPEAGIIPLDQAVDDMDNLQNSRRGHFPGYTVLCASMCDAFCAEFAFGVPLSHAPRDWNATWVVKFITHVTGEIQ